jgi:nucleoside-diphosphate-sugar epimerase
MTDLPEWRDSSILITGAQGFIGRHLTRAIAQLNPKKLVLLGSSVQRHPDDAPMAKYVQLDLRNKTDVQNFAQNEDFDIIYNLAGKIDQSVGEGKYEEQLEINYLATLYLVEAFQDKVNLFVHIGTNAEYGNAPVPHDPYLTCEQPNSAYGVSKLAATKMLLAKAQSQNLNVKIFRPFLVFGVGQNPKSLLGQVISAIQTKKPLETPADQQTRDLISVSRVVERLTNRVVLTSGEKIENCCSGIELKIRDVLDFVQNHNISFSYKYQSALVRKTELLRSYGVSHNPSNLTDVKKDIQQWLSCEV